MPVKPDPLGDLKLWLQSLGLERHYETFVAQDIDLTVLGELTEDDLRELGLSLGHRKKILAALHSRAGEPAAAHDAGDNVPSRPERRQITVLFCDLVGSTRLAAILDPEDMRDVLSAYDETCSGVIQRFSGHVANYLGDGVLAFFGFPNAHEDDAENAVRAALEMVEAVRHLPTPSAGELQVRVGIATGLVVVGDLVGMGAARQERVVGETPNLAARLQTLAEPDQVVVAPATRRLAGASFEYEDLGSHALKGFEAPIQAFRVIRESAFEGRFAARSAGRRLGSIIGREAELALLRERWTRSAAGHGQMVLIEGEPGIGKSRLVQELRQSLAGVDHLRFVLHCVSYLANSVLHPVIKALERGAGFAPDDSAETRLEKLETLFGPDPEHLATCIPLVAHLLDVPTGDAYPAAPMDANTRARRTLEALVRHVERLARLDPLLMICEDMHWADPTTLELFALLIERLPKLPLMVVATSRPEFHPPWGTADHISRIVLRRLDHKDSTRVIEALTGGSNLPGSVLEQILAKTDGVPLFLEELTRNVMESGIVKRSGEEYVEVTRAGGLAIPDTLQDSLMARLDRLSPVKEVAQTGSVIGREFTAAMLAAVEPHQPDALTDALDQLQRADIITRIGRDAGGRFIFRHALVQDAAYESLLKSRRVAIHAKIAEAMETGEPAFAGTEPESIAYHCQRAGLTRDAMRHWFRAGQKALDRGSNKEALVHLNAALAALRELPESEDVNRTELALQMSLAPASMAIYGWASKEVEACCRRARELAIELQDHVSLYGAQWGIWTTHFTRGEIHAALEASRLVEEMAGAAGGEMLALTAHHAHGFSLYFHGDVRAALAHAEAAAPLFDPEMERQLVRMFQLSSTVALRSFGAASLWMLGREAQAERALRKALALAEDLEHAPSLAFCLGFSNYIHMFRRDWTGMREAAQRQRDLSEEEGFQLWLPQSRVFLGIARAGAGELEEGIADIERNIATFRATGNKLTLMQMYPVYGELLDEAGRASEAVELLGTIMRDADARGEFLYMSELHRVHALARHATGDASGALADLDSAVRIAREQGAEALKWRAAVSKARILADEDSPAAAATFLASVLVDANCTETCNDLAAASTYLQSLTSARPDAARPLSAT